jgi:hypothetical protein
MFCCEDFAFNNGIFQNISKDSVVSSQNIALEKSILKKTLNISQYNIIIVQAAKEGTT